MASPGIVVRLRPIGPWRIGPNSGARERIDPVLHSDSLFSAVTCAMQQLGFLTHWLSVTAESDQPDVRITSAFPYAQQNLFVPPPRHTWPPGAGGKVRWKSARFVPISLTPVLLREEDLDQERWAVDPVSGCLLPVGKHGAPQAPFRVGLRATAPVDRITRTSGEAFSSACLEFTQGSGMWCLILFANGAARESWAAKLRSAFRLLADTGFGGERSRGWGRSKPPQFQDVDLEQFLPAVQTEGGETAWWLLSLYAAGSRDNVDWRRGDYTLLNRSGRAERTGLLKQASRMIEEGSVVFSSGAPVGSTRDAAPEGSPHPVYRWGFAAAFPVPVRRHGVKYRLTVAAPEPEPSPEPVEEPLPESPPVEEPPAQEPPAEEPPAEEPPAEEPPPEEPQP
jgi:CRISPR type III-A-associated RAMP protein Csm4